MLIHVANTFVLLSFLVKEIMYLRLLSILGGFAFIGYFSLSFDVVQWSPISWNLLFILINLYQIIRIIIERRPIQFNERELQLKRKAFPNISDREWFELLKIGEWKYIPQENYSPAIFVNSILILSDGYLQKNTSHRNYFKLEQGSLIGGINFLTGKLLDEEFDCNCDIEILTWSIPSFRSFLQEKPQTSAEFQKLIGQEIIRHKNS